MYPAMAIRTVCKDNGQAGKETSIQIRITITGRVCGLFMVPPIGLEPISDDYKSPASPSML
jgi:hypothetical protein